MVATVASDTPAIELRRLHRYFGTTRAVDDVTLEIEPGCVFGFIGPNGAGKTTTMRILATLDLPTFGDALVTGFSVVTDPERAQKRLGFMPDQYGAYRHVTCEEYLDFFARAYGLTGRERHQRVRRVMEFTGVDKLSEKTMRSLSKGMRQRLCLGRAMIHDPDVLVLDEPAAGLDPRARIELRQMIRQLATDGKAVLVSSHILSELAEIADRFGIIEQGRLVVAGTLEEIERSATGGRTVELRVVSRADELQAWLGKREDVANVTRSGNRFSMQHTGETEESEAELLREIVVAGFPVVAFGVKQQSLEDLFMHMTEGIVQ